MNRQPKKAVGLWPRVVCIHSHGLTCVEANVDELDCLSLELASLHTKDGVAVNALALVTKSHRKTIEPVTNCRLPRSREFASISRR